jgi:hypothetical protein
MIFRPLNHAPMQVVAGRPGRERVHFQAPAAKLLAKEMNDGAAQERGRLRMTGLSEAQSPSLEGPVQCHLRATDRSGCR